MRRPNPGVWDYGPIPPPANGAVRPNAPDRKYEQGPSEVQGPGEPWEAALARARWEPLSACSRFFRGRRPFSPGLHWKQRHCPGVCVQFGLSPGRSHCRATIFHFAIRHYNDKRTQKKNIYIYIYLRAGDCRCASRARHGRPRLFAVVARDLGDQLVGACEFAAWLSRGVARRLLRRARAAA